MNIPFSVLSTDKDAPAVSKEDGENYVRAVMATVAERVAGDMWQWSRYLEGVGREGSPPGWDALPDRLRGLVVRIAGKRLFQSLMVAVPISKALAAGRAAITQAAAEDAIRQAIDDEMALGAAGKAAPAPSVSPPAADSGMEKPTGTVSIDIGPKNENSPSVTYGKGLAVIIGQDLVKALHPLVADFYPAHAEQWELYLCKGIVPDGFLSRDDVAAICPECSGAMKRADLPLVKAERFERDIAWRVARDVFKAPERWASALLAEAPEYVADLAKSEDAAGYDLTKCEYADRVKELQGRAAKRRQRHGKKPRDEAFTVRVQKSEFLEAVLDPPISPTLADFLKAQPAAAIRGWAKKMRREGGEHPHTWCTAKAGKFASDPAAFCAAVHMEAFGKTPSQRKKEKKSEKKG